MSKKKRNRPTSPAVKAANQANAQKSTGPKTPDGKAASSQNSVKHGLTAKECKALSWEDQADYNAFRRDIIATYDPQTAEEEAAVMQVVSLQWRMDRIHTLENKAIEACEETPQALSKHLREFNRYHVNLQKLLEKAYALLAFLLEGREDTAPNRPAAYVPMKDRKAQYKRFMDASLQAIMQPMVPMDPLSQAARWEEYKASLSPEERAEIEE